MITIYTEEDELLDELIKWLAAEENTGGDNGEDGTSEGSSSNEGHGSYLDSEDGTGDLPGN